MTVILTIVSVYSWVNSRKVRAQLPPDMLVICFFPKVALNVVWKNLLSSTRSPAPSAPVCQQKISLFVNEKKPPSFAYENKKVIDNISGSLKKNEDNDE